MKQIFLSKGKIAFVDDELYDEINLKNWFADPRPRTWYAKYSKKFDGKKRKVYMHHLVLGILRLPRILGLVVDHIDGNGLNNQRSNLRVVTISQNNTNSYNHRNKKPMGVRYKGWTNRPWEAYCSEGGKTKYLGCYSTELEAHNAYLKYRKGLDK